MQQDQHVLEVFDVELHLIFQSEGYLQISAILYIVGHHLVIISSLIIKWTDRPRNILGKILHFNSLLPDTFSKSSNAIKITNRKVQLQGDGSKQQNKEKE